MGKAGLCPQCRKTRLSRYNNEPLCAACTRAAREPGSGTPSWLYDSAPMRRALARDDIPLFSVVFRAASGMSQHDLARITGLSQSTISCIETRRRRPLDVTRKFFRFTDAIGMPRVALLPFLLGREDVTLADIGIPEGTGTDVDRRTFGGVAAGLLASAALPQAQVPDRVDAAQIRFLHACAERMRIRYWSVGGGAVLREALGFFSRARLMLDESDYSETVGRQLLVVTAHLGIESGWFAYDHGDQQLARRLYSDAEMLAGDTGDSQLIVHVCGVMARQSVYLARVHQRRGLAREALRLADKAAEAARHEPAPRLHAVAAMRQAVAHAQLGDEVAFRSAITRARRALDRGDHPADPAWARFVTHTEVTVHEAMGWERLGSPGQAVTLWRNVANDQNRLPRNQVFAQSNLARALLDEGNVTLAIDEGRAVLQSFTAARMTSARPISAMRPVRAAAENAGDEEFCSRFDAVERTLTAA